MSKLCHQCFHTARGICKSHNSEDEYNRKFYQAMSDAFMPLVKWTADYVFQPNPLWEAFNKGMVRDGQ